MKTNKKLLTIALLVVMVISLTFLLSACGDPIPVYVVNVKVEGLKTNYEVGEQLNLENIKVVLTYSNENVASFAVQQDMIEDFDTSQAGQSKFLKIVVAGFSVSFGYSVQEVKEYKSYNLVATAGTLPTLFAGLAVAENGFDTFMAYERTATFNKNLLLPNIIELREMDGVDDNTAVGLVNWIKDKAKSLYELHEGKVIFNLFADDLRVGRMLQIFEENSIPKSNYNMYILSDGTASYGIGELKVYENSNAKEIWDANQMDWNSRYGRIHNGHSAGFSYSISATDSAKYLYNVATQSNVEYWVHYPDVIKSYVHESVKDNFDSINFVAKSPNEMFANLSAESKIAFQAFVSVDKEYFDGLFYSNERPNMIITGTSVAGSGDFSAYIRKVVELYDDKYDLFYKPHPSHMPVAGGVIDQNILDEYNITVLPGRLPMEALLWIYQDVAIGGYNSSLYMSARVEQVKFFLRTTPSSLAKPLDFLFADNSDINFINLD